MTKPSRCWASPMLRSNRTQKGAFALSTRTATTGVLPHETPLPIANLVATNGIEQSNMFDRPYSSVSLQI